MPNRINKVIELWEQSQPVYATHPHELTYEDGREMVKTWADYISIDMEHAPFDVPGLSAFMRGMADGGPTNSGHQTPAVIVSVPAGGFSEDEIRANQWQFRQVLATGVHGINLCQGEGPEAVKAFIEACRYQHYNIGVGQGLQTGRRGGAGQHYAAPIWGLSSTEYVERADVWPMNSDGEIILGLKLESIQALDHIEAIVKVPGLAFVEFGPGDMGLSMGYPDAHNPPYPSDMLQARQRTMDACKEAGLKVRFTWHEQSMSVENRVKRLLREEVNILGMLEEDGAIIGRKLTNRTMAV